MSLRNRTHGYATRATRVPEYAAWAAMKSRCTDVNHPAYGYYGGRGIVVCATWMVSFEAFLADMGPRPTPGLTLERRDVNGAYEPGNCYWATWAEQQNNRSRHHFVWVDEVRLTLTQAVTRHGLGVTAHLVGDRLRYGWPLGLALLMAPDRKARTRVSTSRSRQSHRPRRF